MERDRACRSASRPADVARLGRIRWRILECVWGGASRSRSPSVHATRAGRVDGDPVLVALAEERVRRGGIAARVIHGDVRALPLPAESFDLA